MYFAASENEGQGCIRTRSSKTSESGWFDLHTINMNLTNFQIWREKTFDLLQQPGRPVLGEIANRGVPTAVARSSNDLIQCMFVCHGHRAFRVGNAAVKKQTGGAAGKPQEEKTRGGEKKLKAPGKSVPEIRKEVSRVKGESKGKEGEEENKGKEKEVNKEKGSDEESQPKDVVEEKPEHTTEVNERVEGDGGEEVEADGEVLPDGVHDVDAYCDNKEPHVRRSLICRKN